MGDTEVEELHEFRGEAVIEACVAVNRPGGLLVVDMAQPVEGALEIDAGLGRDGPEERHGVELSVAANEATPLREADQCLGRVELEERVLKQGPRKGVSTGSGSRGHP